jgi:hypothetical protein
MKHLFFKLAYLISSPKLTAGLLFYCVVFIFAATLEIPSKGIAQVQAEYFETWMAMWWHLPLPGGKAIGLIALANLLLSSFRFGRSGAKGLGFASVHIALVLLILSAFMQSMWRKEGVIVLHENMPADKIISKNADGEMKDSLTLPFSVELVKFTQESWQNTNLPSRFSSLVKFHYESITQEKLIKMNEPASFGSWTFYQSSFADEGRTSVLQAVHNPAALLPWVSIILIFCGMVFTYAYRFFIKK